MDEAGIKKAYDGVFDEVGAATFVVLAPSGRILSVNNEAEELTGYEKAELESMAFSSIFRQEDQDRILQIFAQPVSTPFQKLFEHNVIIQKRSRRKIVVDMGFRRSKAAFPNAFVFTLQDITEIKMNETRVTRAHEYVHSIIQSIRELLVVIDQRGTIQTVNDAAVRMLEYSRKELVGMPIERIMTGLGGRKVAATGDLAEVEMMLTTKSQRQIPVLLSASTMQGPGADQNGRIAIVAMDISERKKAEALIAEQQMIIVQAAKMSSLGEMASGIAHEINNPLHVIIGNCDMLTLYLDSLPGTEKEARECARMIDQMGVRIQKIVHGLKVFSRDQSNDPLESVSLASIVRDTLALCEQRFFHHGVQLEIEPIAEDIVLNCRPTLLSQVLLNLLNNAFDAVAPLEDGWIRVKAREVDDHVEICVEDSGRGIPEELVEKVFKPFFTTKAVGKGTGLGLSISRSIVESHQGRLEYDRSGPRPRFVVTLPRTREEAASRSKARGSRSA